MEVSYYPLIRAHSYEIPSRFVVEVSRLAQDLGNELTGNQLGIQQSLERAIQESWPELAKLGKEIVRCLESDEGFVVVRDLPLLSYGRPIIDLAFIALATCLGKLTVHDDSKKLIWDVTPRPQIEGRELTFSERDVEAPLHIDSAFRQQPEEYFGLLAITAAEQGGHSVVLRADRVIRALEQSDAGSQCLAILRSEMFPFRVPPAFANSGEANQIIQAPIIADAPLIRFRLDTILSGFKCHPELATPQQLWALNYFNNFLEASPHKFELKLNDGDIIFVNNHTVLHSRTAFEGNSRLLLRLRIRKTA